MQMPFGKHKGTPIAELPDDYLTWLFEEAAIKEGHLKRNIEREYKTRFEPKAKSEQGQKERPKSGPGCWRCSFFEGLSKEQKDLAAFMIDAWCNELKQDLEESQGQLRGSLDVGAVIQAIQTIRDMVTTKA